MNTNTPMSPEEHARIKASMARLKRCSRSIIPEPPAKKYPDHKKDRCK